MKLTLNIPGPSGGSEAVPLPSSIPPALGGGAGTSGAKLLQLGIEYFTITATILALIVIMVSGIQMIVSKGDAYKLAEAKKRLLYGVLGLIIVLSAFFIIRIILFILKIDTEYLFNPASLLN